MTMGSDIPKEVPCALNELKKCETNNFKNENFKINQVEEEEEEEEEEEGLNRERTDSHFKKDIALNTSDKFNSKVDLDVRYTAIAKKMKIYGLEMSEEEKGLWYDMHNFDTLKFPKKKPDWLDMNRFRKGQKFARENFAGLALASMEGLILMLSFKPGLRVLIHTQKSHTPSKAFRRYMSTISRVRNWYTEDPWTEETSAHADIRRVNDMHLEILQRIKSMGNEKIVETSVIKNPCCPMINVLRTDFEGSYGNGIPMDIYHKAVPAINQLSMSYTQFAFVGLAVLFPTEFGIHKASKEDLENLCYIWRGIGYLLGIKDRYNFFRGSLDDIKERSWEFLDHYFKPNLPCVSASWEHMSKCIVRSIASKDSNVLYLLLLHLMGALDIAMPGLHDALGYSYRIKFYLLRFALRYLMKLPSVVSVANMIVHGIIDKGVYLITKNSHKIRTHFEKSPLNCVIET